MPEDFFQAKDRLQTTHGSYSYYRLNRLEQLGLTRLDRLPFTIRVLLEGLLRQCDGQVITPEDVRALAGWKPRGPRPPLPYRPARVLLQDLTGVPAVVDLAAMRSVVARLGGDPAQVNPLLPVDLVVDHSVQVDFFASPDALRRNAEMELLRNRERYELLRWGQKAFQNFRIIPPGMGILHQVNMEYLAQVVMAKDSDGERLAVPDTLVGADSHTTQINGLGVVGWGIGGLDAEAVMLGQPVYLVTPDVIGFKLYGKLAEGLTASDLAMTITQVLRSKGVVDKFVEFCGPGLDGLTLPERAAIANMAPEYGATMGFFPVDDETLRYLRLTGRSEEVVERVEIYCKAQGLFRGQQTLYPDFTEVIELDLSTVTPSLAGPRRPQDRVALNEVQRSFRSALAAPAKDGGYDLKGGALERKIRVGSNGNSTEVSHVAVLIAAIASRTHTANPSLMILAGLLAKKAVERGLSVRPHIKTSMSPGSRVVGAYLQKAGLLEPLAKLGFNIVGYGCMTCIGNSGPLTGDVVRAITGGELVAVAVLSGNRNFEGRIHPYIKASYLASPPLVVAYALAGTVDIDLTNSPLGTNPEGSPIFLSDIWPTSQEVQETLAGALDVEMFQQNYEKIFTGNENWNAIQAGDETLYPWSAASTYIQEPPFFTDFSPSLPALQPLSGGRVLAFLGDSVTTDHISPAGLIPIDGPAGRYLVANGVPPRDFNTFGARRGNDRVMVRGTFAGIRLKNRLLPGVGGGMTRHFPNGEQMSIYDAALKYQQEGVPLLVLAGKEYGTGSSRDWAAKGTRLLGVRAVIAESFERIHRTNLVGMGVLPLQFMPGESADSLGLVGNEAYTLEDLDDNLGVGSQLTVQAVREDGSRVIFQVRVGLHTPAEAAYYRSGGVLNAVLKKMLID